MSSGARGGLGQAFPTTLRQLVSLTGFWNAWDGHHGSSLSDATIVAGLELRGANPQVNLRHWFAWLMQAR
ncbi:hypothetical protein CGRA01v4_04034 [Colletotrichum graminicola]|nr:hypothetical protein CGRA01v4_04034 [Colletotrichum graminicola]